MAGRRNLVRYFTKEIHKQFGLWEERDCIEFYRTGKRPKVSTKEITDWLDKIIDQETEREMGLKFKWNTDYLDDPERPARIRKSVIQQFDWAHDSYLRHRKDAYSGDSAM